MDFLSRNIFDELLAVVSQPYVKITDGGFLIPFTDAKTFENAGQIEPRLPHFFWELSCFEHPGDLTWIEKPNAAGNELFLLKPRRNEQFNSRGL